MKKGKLKSKGISKGAPSGFVISLLVHAAAFMLAGLLVVFTVQHKEEQKFIPPEPVERPKMKLKKPKVKVKKSAKPKSTTRIVTKVQKANMPDIQLPEMSGIGDGLGGGLDGFDLMPDMGEITVFGSGQSIGNDFVGTFYDLKRTRQGSMSIMDTDQFQDTVSKFVRSGWRTSKLAQYYRSPKKLYATTFMVPTTRSYVAPRAFGEPETVGWCWLAHYKGQLVHKDGIRFRFWGQGDDILLVRVNGKVVLNASWPNSEQIYSNWHTSDSKTRTYRLGNNLAAVGDWITLEPNEPLNMEVLCGEVPGGSFDMMLLVEEEGVEYERNSQNGPILPIFKTEQPGHELMDAIYEWLVPGEADLVGGPVFCDFASKGGSSPEKADTVEPEIPAYDEELTRPWSLLSGKRMEAEYVCMMGGNVVLKTEKGKQVKIPLKSISPEDREYIALENPPEFKVDFIKSVDSDMNRYKLSPKESDWQTAPARVNDYTFGVSVEQPSARPYDHNLTIAYYAVGVQRLDDSTFKLLDRQQQTAFLSDCPDLTHSFTGKTVELIDFDLASQRRGIAYYGYLVTLTDKRGKIIQYAASNDWLYQHLDSLREIPVGAFMNKECKRVHASGPRRNY